LLLETPWTRGKIVLEEPQPFLTLLKVPLITCKNVKVEPKYKPFGIPKRLREEN
jgi:hypothetical protein